MSLQGFDKTYYLSAKLANLKATTPVVWANKTTTDLETTLNSVGYTAESHYQTFGWHEGLAPNAYFNAFEYEQSKGRALFLSGYSESPTDGVNDFRNAWTADPYLHYINFGAFESGINPSNSFDQNAYYTTKLAALKANTATQAEWTDVTVTDLRNHFHAAGINPIQHYLTFGTAESLTVVPVAATAQVPSSISTLAGGQTITLVLNAYKTTAASELDNVSSASTVNVGGNASLTLNATHANTSNDCVHITLDKVSGVDSITKAGANTGDVILFGAANTATASNFETAAWLTGTKMNTSQFYTQSFSAMGSSIGTTGNANLTAVQHIAVYTAGNDTIIQVFNTTAAVNLSAEGPMSASDDYATIVLKDYTKDVATEGITGILKLDSTGSGLQITLL